MMQLLASCGSDWKVFLSSMTAVGLSAAADSSFDGGGVVTTSFEVDASSGDGVVTESTRPDMVPVFGRSA